MLNNINVKILRGGYEMYKYKFVFFLTSLLFIFICTILVSAPASAQGSFFDALCGAIANNINELVIGQEVDQETKQIQISAVKVFLRGDESDWDELVDSTKDWAESSLKTESSKTTQSTTYRNEQQKFVKEVSRIKKDVGKTYYFEGKIGNIDFTMKVPPYKCKCGGIRDVVNREAIISGIYPINRTASSGNKIKSFFNNILGGTKKNKQHFVILRVFDAKTKGYWPSGMSNCDASYAFGSFAVIVDEETKYLDIFKDATHILGAGGWDIPLMQENVRWNIPDVFIYDLDHDGFDEITILSGFQGGGGAFKCLHMYSTKKIPLEKPYDLRIYSDVYYDDGYKDTFYHNNIYFDGDNLYVDGKNIMDYQ
jgi:hypothetical protein